MADNVIRTNLIFESNAVEIKQEIDKLNSSIEKTTDSTEQVTKAQSSSTSSFKSNTTAILENGGAMGILNDLTGGYAMTLKDAVEASALFTKSTKAQTVATEAQSLATRASIIGLKALKLAFAATGIGLLITGAALLVHNWDRVTKTFKDLLPSAESVNSVMNKLTEIAVGVGTAIINYVITPFKAWTKLIKGDFKGAIEEVKNGLNVIGNFQKGVSKERLAQQESDQLKQLESTIKHNERLIEVQKAAGKDTFALELQNSKLKQKLLKEDNEKLEEEQQKEKVLRATHQKELSDKAREAREKAAQEAKEAEEKRLQAILDARKEFAEKTKFESEDIERAEVTVDDLVNKIKTDGEKENEAKKQVMLDDLANKVAVSENAVNEAKRTQEELANINDLELQSKLQLAEQIGNVLANLEQLFKKGTAAQKIAALATIAINTGIGFIQGLDIAQKAAAGTGPAAALAFPIFYASQVAAVLGAAASAKAALSNTNSSSTSGATTAGNNITAATQPNVSFVASSNSQLAGTINQGTLTLSRTLTSKPIKAFVVSTDITTQQALDRKISSANSII